MNNGESALPHFLDERGLNLWPRLRVFDEEIPANYLHYKRKTKAYKAVTALGWAQPLPAYVGFLGSITILIFTSAMWWNSPATFTKVAMAYGAVRYILTSSKLIYSSLAFHTDSYIIAFGFVPYFHSVETRE
jgi:hypothetical protein